MGVDVGGKLAFEGYQLVGWTPSPGSEFGLLTLWGVESPLPNDRDGVILSQLLDEQNQVVAQQDLLSVPSWNWRPGDGWIDRAGHQP